MKPLLVPVETLEQFLAAHGWTMEDLELGRAKIGDHAVTLPEVQAYLINRDPVLWGEAMLVNRPEDGGGTWRFFHYQKPSLRFRGHTVHEDGAEVGKTRELVALILWGSTTRKGGSLVGSSQDSDLDEIWEEIEWQLSQNRWLADQVEASRTKVKPYKKLVFRNGNIVRFRPAGHDGRAFRAVHVGQFGIFDEAAKPKNPVVFSEFFRALKPGCEARFYSVPDGIRASPFYQLCERAVAFETAGAREDLSGGVGARRRFTKFHWSKTLMPSPFWDEEREREAIEFYGGRDSSGYQRNVLGLWGDPEDTVFPWAQFSPCVRFIDSYIRTKILFDSATDTYYIEAHRLSPSYTVQHGSEVESEDDQDAAPMTEVYRGSFGKGNLDFRAALRRIFMPLDDGAHTVGGVDVGLTNDPTEAGISQLKGVRAWTARLSLKHLDYDEQAAALGALDEIYRPDHGWGLDAGGGYGSGLENAMRRGDDGLRWDDRLTGFIFNSKREELDPETGEPKIDPATGNPRKVTLKELSTQLLESAMQRGLLAVPWDPDYVRDFTSHTATKLTSGERKFSGRNDHVIDEKRVEMLRELELEYGLDAPVIEYATPPNSRRASAFMDAF